LTGKYGEEGNQLMFKILKRGEKLDVSDKNLADLALRYDLTVPLARVVANYKNELPKFFKRYQIQPVWRADRPARGRFREFYQCDVDAIGSSSMMVEAELCAAVSEILERLGFDNFEIRVNHRKLLIELLDAAGVPSDKHIDALISLDKLDKIGREGVTKEFLQRGVSQNSAEKLLVFFESIFESNITNLLGKHSTKKLIELQKQLTEKENEIAVEREKLLEDTKFPTDLVNKANELLSKYSETDSLIDINKIQEYVDKITESQKIVTEAHNRINLLLKQKGNFGILISLLEFLSSSSSKEEYEAEGISDLTSLLYCFERNRTTKIKSLEPISGRIRIDPTLARGLSYYTGAIFEINVPDLAGSLGGGGRYDGLIGMFSKEESPACGFSLGLERILVVMEERGMFDKLIAEGKLKADSADVMIACFDETLVGECLKLANELRQKDLRVLVYPEANQKGKPIKYAEQIKVPFVCLLKENELAENKVTLKNMQTGEQETLLREEVAVQIFPVTNGDK
jgi:histidyl-tRNA synthetase